MCDHVALLVSLCMRGDLLGMSVNNGAAAQNSDVL